MGSVADHLGDGSRGRGRTVSIDVANGVLHHDHRAIHHHAEIERTEGKQVGRNMADVEPDGGEQQRERNREGHDQSGADIAQEQQKHDGHQDHAFTQVVHHRVQGIAQEIGAIQHGNYLHAGRQDAVIELFHLLVDALQRGPRVGAFAHQHDALNDVGFVDDVSVLHVVSPGHVAQTNLGALRHLGDVLHPQGGPFLRLQDGLLDVADIAEKAERADVHLLQARLHEAAAGVDIVAGELLLHLADAQAVGHQLVRVHAHLVFPDRSPEIGDIHHVRNGLELFEQRPIFNRPELHQVVSRIGAAQRVPVDLTNGAPVRANLRLQPGG